MVGNSEQRLVRMGFALLGAFAALPFVWLAIYTATPYLEYFEYSAVLPAQETFLVGTYPSFVSVRWIKETTSIEWIDIEMCQDQNGAYRRRAAYESKSKNVTTTNGMRQSVVWTWGEDQRLPTVNTETTCYLDTTIIKPAPFDFLRTMLDKKQHLISPPYKYVNP